LHDLQLNADHGDLLAPFARLLLAVDALREKDTAKARGYLNEMTDVFPQKQPVPKGTGVPLPIENVHLSGASLLKYN
jgi:hypothetical protein